MKESALIISHWKFWETRQATVSLGYISHTGNDDRVCLPIDDCSCCPLVFWMTRVALTPRPVSLYSLFHMKQRDADKVDLWLTNSFLLPLTVLNVSLPPRLQGAMKVRNKFKRNSSEHRDHSGRFSLCRRNWLSKVRSVIFSLMYDFYIVKNLIYCP